MVGAGCRVLAFAEGGEVSVYRVRRWASLRVAGWPFTICKGTGRVPASVHRTRVEAEMLAGGLKFSECGQTCAKAAPEVRQVTSLPKRRSEGKPAGAGLLPLKLHHRVGGRTINGRRGLEGIGTPISLQ
jgi:hypothetical protein